MRVGEGMRRRERERAARGGLFGMRACACAYVHDCPCRCTCVFGVRASMSALNHWQEDENYYLFVYSIVVIYPCSHSRIFKR